MPEPALLDQAHPDSTRGIDLSATGPRIDALLDAASSAGPLARERSEELVRLVTDLYGAGLERLLDLLHQTGHLDDPLLATLAADELVSSLLLVHGLHPYELQTRVEQALDSVRPYLGSHGGDVELLEVSADGTVRLRLLGSCDGCPSSAVTLELAVEDAIRAAAPEITDIAVDAASPDRLRAAPPAFLPLESVWSRPPEPQAAEPRGAAWVTVPELATLDPGAVGRTVAGPLALVGCRVGSDLFAFRDACAGCPASLAEATLGRRLGGAAGDAILRCAGCARHYDVRRAGLCLEDAELHLDPLPLLVTEAGVRVAVPSPAVLLG